MYSDLSVIPHYTIAMEPTERDRESTLTILINESSKIG